MESWTEIRYSVESLERGNVLDVPAALSDLGTFVRDFENRARDKARDGILATLGDHATFRYRNDSVFKTELDLIIQLVTSALFDQSPLTQGERDRRVIVLDRLPEWLEKMLSR